MWGLMYEPDVWTYNIQLGKYCLQWCVLHVSCKAFIEPQVIPPAHRYQVSKPLRHNIRLGSEAYSRSLFFPQTHRQTQLPDGRARVLWRRQLLVFPEKRTVCPPAGWSLWKWWVPSSPWLLPGSLGWLPSLTKQRGSTSGCVKRREKKEQLRGDKITSKCSCVLT